MARYSIKFVLAYFYPLYPEPKNTDSGSTRIRNRFAGRASDRKFLEGFYPDWIEKVGTAQPCPPPPSVCALLKCSI